MMRRFQTALVVLFLSCSMLTAAEPAAVEYELPRPEWAWGTVGLRSIEGSLGKLAAYCDRIAANSGAFARLSLATWLFSVPLEEGLNKDGPAVVFLLDPGQVGGAKGEKALILSVTDAELLKESLEAVFGEDMKNGEMQVAVPRGFTEPDANLLIKLTSSGLLVAPTKAILKELEKLAGKKGAASFMDPKGSDVTMELNIEIFRRIEQRRLDAMLGNLTKGAGVAAPAAAAKITEGQQRLQKFLKELSRLEVDLAITAQQVGAKARLRAFPNTECALRWSPCPAPPVGTWNSWCDPDVAIFVAGPFPAIWAYPEQEIAKWLAKYLPMESAQGRGAQADVARELAALFTQLDGDMALAVRVDQKGVWFPLTMFGGTEDGQLNEGFEKLLKPVAVLLAEQMRTHFELPAEAPLPAVLEKKSDGPQGITRHAVRFKDPKVEAWAKKNFSYVCGWPLEFSSRRSGSGMILGWGHGADALLKMEPAVRGDGRKPIGLLPKGTAGGALLHPVTIMRFYLLQIRGVDQANAQAILKGLPNTPVNMYWGQGEGALQLELKVPVDAPRSVASGYLNYLKMDFDPEGDPAAEDAPAPAPVEK